MTYAATLERLSALKARSKGEGKDPAAKFRTAWADALCIRVITDLSPYFARGVPASALEQVADADSRFGKALTAFVESGKDEDRSRATAAAEELFTAWTQATEGAQ